MVHTYRCNLQCLRTWEASGNAGWAVWVFTAGFDHRIYVGMGSMVEIYQVQLTKAALAQIDSAERSLLLLLGHVSNEIIVLQKILLQMREPVELPHIVQVVSSGQMLIVLRVLIGKLSEAWRLFEKRVKANPAMRETYIEKLPPEAQASLNWLNKEFGKGSALQQIRNKLSNHYVDDEDLIEANFRQLGDNEAWDFSLERRPQIHSSTLLSSL